MFPAPRCRRLPAATLGLLAATFAVAAAAHAQTPETPAQTPPSAAGTAVPPPPAVVAPTAPTAPPTVDPQARAVLDKMIAAQQALTTYTANAEIRAVAGGRERVATGKITYKKPGKVRAVMTDPAAKSTLTLLSDGVSRYATLSTVPKEYGKATVAPGPRVIADTLVMSRLSASGMLALLISNPNAGRLIVPPSADVALAPEETLDGVPVEVVRLSVPAQIEPSGRTAPATTVTLSVGKADRLLRRVRLETVGAAGPSVLTETYSAVQGNPTLPPTTFVFTPPPGAKLPAVPEEEQFFDPRLKVGTRPFPISGRDLKGRSVSLAQYKGKVLLVDFWAMWCAPCVEELPNVVSVYNRYRGKGFDVLGVSMDRAGDRARLKSFVRANRMPWRQVYDGGYIDAAMAKRYGVVAIPFTLLIDRDGKIVAVNPRAEDLEPSVRAAVAKK